jgi:hypothetical protein
MLIGVECTHRDKCSYVYKYLHLCDKKKDATFLSLGKSIDVTFESPLNRKSLCVKGDKNAALARLKKKE